MDQKLSTSHLNVNMHSVDELIETNFLHSAYAGGHSIRTYDTKWVHNSVDAFRAWIYETFKEYRTFASNTDVIYIFFRNSLIRIYLYSTNAQIDVMGNLEDNDAVISLLQTSPFTKAGSTIDWVHSKDGDTISVPLRQRPLIKSAYPWIAGSVDDYMDRFMDSSASVLILIGPPGTGKTSFISHMINRINATATVAYDENIMSGDTLFANWLESSNRFLCLEDSDAFLSARSDGNRMMHKFLNVSEGLVSVNGKKMIFSTNLPKVTDIDQALMRPGRCFDVLTFRQLSYDEAVEVSKEVSISTELLKDKSYSLTDLFNNNTVKTKPKIGFGFCN